MDQDPHTHTHVESVPTAFPTDPGGLPEATAPPVLDLEDGDLLELTVAPVAKRLGATTVRMLAFNGSIPGPTLRVRQGSELVVHVVNQGDLDTTVHWHGLRLDNRYDGVPHETQTPIPVGGDFTYRIQFPDPGLYWYHPHIREDYTQELGLYGNIVVSPNDLDYWPPVDDEVVLTLDDLLLEDGRIAPFSPAVTTHAAMGRYGNVFLVAGQTALELGSTVDRVTRLWLTNTANSRVFNLRIPGAEVKLVGGDSGRVEHEELVSELLLAPSERVVLDVLFRQPGEYHLEHHTPRRHTELASVTVREKRDTDNEPARAAAAFHELRHDPELESLRRELPGWLARPPDKVLALVATIDDPAAGHTDPGTAYRCPMHPEVTSDAPGRCPKCGMKLLQTAAGDHHHHTGPAAKDAPPPGHASGIEWEDDMVEVNRLLTSRTGALAGHRPDGRTARRRGRLAFHGGRPREDPAGERGCVRPPHAPPVPRPRRRAVRRAQPRRPARDQPGVEGHRAGPRGTDGGPPVRRHAPRSVDGPLPHRGAPAERHDVRLRRLPPRDRVRLTSRGHAQTAQPRPNGAPALDVTSRSSVAATTSRAEPLPVASRAWMVETLAFVACQDLPASVLRCS